ncbi:Gluconolactonase [Ralstonia mannitolilytica]|uniref:SMP-30/gluconolactonase/LRE family protein n=1 Tax=Ralstonia mannitolilytica TaxID=105219 RepID=UPI0007AFEE37|nr:SMP-30/gluconolactonase/LRE family protein [Ralstonia mannitolilytica]ANA35459.1 gluconolactonase [Ralstonia mannitolilytica]CAJ0688201.1 Gluconolactonase [Ralstonia mannitolilytica]CAJ0875838.1 Gluconolactonase [Ralstonia mannitolilytica]
MTYFNWPRVETTVLAEMPAALRRPVPTEWSRANKGGAPVDCFLEGPCWDARGNLWLVDIPHGRILRVSPQGEWNVVAEYDGEPNGLALRHDDTLLIADYKNGLLSLDPATGVVSPFLTRRNSERFKGPNDLVVARNGDVYFTDQGQTGLHDPTGRVYRLRADGRLDCLLSNGPSPNGVALTPDESALFVAMTRDNAVWRLPLLADGSTSKVGRFAQFYGTSGPDGMAMDAAGNLLVAHASLGAVFALSPHGEPLARIASCRGRTTTNVALTPDGQGLVITESATGSVLQARWSGLEPA